jgi:hypothetical protein
VIKIDLRAKASRWTLVLATSLLVATATAGAAFAWSSDYGDHSYAASGGDDHSNWDNCVYFGGEISSNTFFKPLGDLGRATVILTNGSWVGSDAQDRSGATTSYTNSTYIYSTKKGYVKNTDSVSYSGFGRVAGSILST